MIYLKSFLVGLGMFILAVVFFFAFLSIYIYISTNFPATTGEPNAGFVMNSNWVHFSLLLPLTAGLIAFAGGFYWMVRKHSARNSN